MKLEERTLCSYVNPSFYRRRVKLASQHLGHRTWSGQLTDRNNVDGRDLVVAKSANNNKFTHSPLISFPTK